MTEEGDLVGPGIVLLVVRAVVALTLDGSIDRSTVRVENMQLVDQAQAALSALASTFIT